MGFLTKKNSSHETNATFGRSVVKKWWLIISASIFCILFAFSFLILNENFTRQKQEKLMTTEFFTQEIMKLVAELNEEVTAQNIVELLQEATTYTVKDQTYQRTLAMMGLHEQDIDIKLFNTSKEEIFQTQNWEPHTHIPIDLKTVIVKEDGQDAVRSMSAIFSKDSRILIGYISVTNRMTNYHMYRKNLLNFYTLMMVGVLVVAIILGYILADQMFKPLKEIQAVISSINEENIATTRITVPKTDDEHALVATHFNELLDKINFYIEQQKQFVEDVSHELRTPVAIVEGHLNLLNRWGKSDPVILEESLASSLLELNRMKVLVQEMLDLSRASFVKEQYKDAEIEIRTSVKQVIENFKVLYPDFQFTFDDDVNSEIFVSIFLNHFDQILIILLDNAVKYSTERKEIIIGLSSAKGTVEVSIQDFGIGMSKEDAKKVFARFYRVDKARSRERGGNGLGLSIARELIESYGGDITLYSVLDHGSIFRIQLPIKAFGQRIINNDI